MAYEYVPYPKWLYHATEEPRVVQSKEEHDALGSNWYGSPADVPQIPKKPVKRVQ